MQSGNNYTPTSKQECMDELRSSIDIHPLRTPTYEIRKRISSILTETEQISVDIDDTATHQKNVNAIKNHCHVISGLVEDSPSPLSETAVTDEMDTKTGVGIVLTESEYLKTIIEETDGHVGSFDLTHVSTRAELDAALSEKPTDIVLVDAIFEEQAGFRALFEDGTADMTRSSVYPVSVIEQDGVPLLGLSGMLDPDAETESLESIFEPFGIAGQPTLAGLLSTLPDTTLGEQLASTNETVLCSSGPEHSDIETVRTGDADIICLDTATYSSLSDADISQLRGVFGYDTRALVLLSDTSYYPDGSEWIPTLGNRRFNDRPLDLYELTSDIHRVPTANRGDVDE